VIRSLLLTLPLLLGGCLSGVQPTQSDPVCSWTSTVPSHPDTICRAVFRTISAMLRAELHGDTAAIRALSLPGATPVYIADGRRLRTEHAAGLHVVPSFTLEADGPLIGARYDVLGRAPKMQVNEEFTVKLRVTGGSAVIAEARPPLESSADIE